VEHVHKVRVVPKMPMMRLKGNLVFTKRSEFLDVVNRFRSRGEGAEVLIWDRWARGDEKSETVRTVGRRAVLEIS
jgi:hypothetical protein